ncbi:hypothetical protein BHE74_00040249 [Ensete ventricosum]|nr:hypothetical protein BHE74_00040249 [Ensete ventricosum]
MISVKLLEHITFVDTPGVLSGEQQNQHGYDFTGVTSWFAAKCDLIVLLFDPHKIDISDEFNNVIKSLHGHEHASSSLFSPPPASCLTARCSCWNTSHLLTLLGFFLKKIKINMVMILLVLLRGLQQNVTLSFFSLILNVIKSLHGHEYKIRVVLNKADQLDANQVR